MYIVLYSFGPIGFPNYVGFLLNLPPRCCACFNWLRGFPVITLIDQQASWEVSGFTGQQRWRRPVPMSTIRKDNKWDSDVTLHSTSGVQLSTLCVSSKVLHPAIHLHSHTQCLHTHTHVLTHVSYILEHIQVNTRACSLHRLLFRGCLNLEEILLQCPSFF